MRKRAVKWVWRRVAGLVVAVLGLNVLLPPPLDRIQSESVLVRDANGAALRAFPTAQKRWRLPVTLDEVDPHFVEALIRVEDKRFYAHWGVDYLALVRAVFHAVQRGKIDSGASTITMQMARLLEPRPRTMGSKMIEILRAHQIEARLSKTEILEAYLTLAPYGGNLEGVESASWAWFGKNAKMLTDAEIALLLALPQAPESRRPDKFKHNAKRARDNIADELQGFGVWNSGRAKAVRAEHVPESRYAFPTIAWHASARAYALSRAQDQNKSVQSSLRRPLQQAVASRMAQSQADAPDSVQAAAILVEASSGCVLAHVGSIGRDRAGGWLNLMGQARSPGSALKPFIYGIALDRGLVRSDSLLTDFPTDFEGYRPDNFDRGFKGEVRMSEALQYSLNVPAVQILDMFGADNLKATLEFSGIKLRFPRALSGQTGLSLALGAVGVTGEELARMYATLANAGRVIPLRWTMPCEARAEPSAGSRGGNLLSVQSALQIKEVLQAAPAPAGRSPAKLTRHAPQLAYKTGTSYGYRDAWAAGVAGDLVAVVWVGRPDGAPNGKATGRSEALPLLYDLVDIAYSMPPFLEFTKQAERTLFKQSEMAQTGLRVGTEEAGPNIVFPPHDAELFIAADRPGRFVLAAHSDTPVEWYVDSVRVKKDPLGQAVWHAAGEGFFEITAVDSDGKRAQSEVRVRYFANG